MTSKRWLNLILGGLGDRLDGTNDYRSDLLLVVDALVWIGVLSFLVQYADIFLTLWIAGPLAGQPIYWVGTQIIVGYFVARGRKKGVPAKAQADAQSSGGDRLLSDEP